MKVNCVFTSGLMPTPPTPGWKLPEAIGSFSPIFNVAFWLSTDRSCGDCRTRVALSLSTACNIPEGRTVEKSCVPTLLRAESGMEAEVEVDDVPVVAVRPVVLVFGVEVEAVVEVEELGVLMVERGEKLTGRLKLLRAAPKVRVISLET